MTQTMNDTISRQAAIDVADYTDYMGIAAEDVKKVTDEVVKRLKGLPSAEPHWIPVTERLPEDNTEVWVTTEMLSDVTRACWHKDSNLWYHPYYSDCLLVLRPVAWMEISLPKPYNGVNI